METWKDVVGFEGLYKVSSLGRVMSLGNSKTKKDKILKPWKAKGYLKVHLFKDSVRVKKAVHRLVAEVFIPRILGKTYLNHKNKNREDARVENLEWVTARENQLHRYTEV